MLKIYFKNMKKEDKEFLQAEVWNRILRMEDLRKNVVFLNTVMCQENIRKTIQLSETWFMLP